MTYGEATDEDTRIRKLRELFERKKAYPRPRWAKKHRIPLFKSIPLEYSLSESDGNEGSKDVDSIIADNLPEPERRRKRKQMKKR